MQRKNSLFLSRLKSKPNELTLGHNLRINTLDKLKITANPVSKCNQINKTTLGCYVTQASRDVMCFWVHSRAKCKLTKYYKDAFFRNVTGTKTYF